MVSVLVVSLYINKIPIQFSKFMERDGAASIKRVEGGASLLPAAEPAAPAELGRPAGGALECQGGRGLAGHR